MGSPETVLEPIQVPFTRYDLAEEFMRRGFRRGAEIGTFAGVYAKALLLANPALHLTCVDPYESYPDYRDNNRHRHLPRALVMARRRLRRFRPRSELILLRSATAAEQIPLESLDFVYIDGNHAFEYVIQDLDLWTKRVRPGGIIAGDDYYHFHKRPYNFRIQVRDAVNAWTRAYRIQPWYITSDYTFFWEKT